jgi:hypothetical protein
MKTQMTQLKTTAGSSESFPLDSSDSQNQKLKEESKKKVIKIGKAFS